MLALGHSYKIINAEVGAFQGTKYLSYPRENASISSAPDVDIGSTKVEVPYSLDQTPLSISHHSRIVAAPLEVLNKTVATLE